MKKILMNMPRTETTWWEIKRMFYRHPVKTLLALPIATIALGFQMGLYFLTVPFVLFNNILAKL